MYTYIPYEKTHSFSENIPVSKIKFGWAIKNESADTITEISPLFFCRDLHLQLLYYIITKGSWELGNYRLDRDFIGKIDLNNLCLVLSKEYPYTVEQLFPNAYYFLNKLIATFPNLGINVRHHDGVRVVIQFKNSNVYKFPFVLSYITILVRAAAFTASNLGIKKFHELNEYVNIKDFQLLSEISYDMMHKIITNINTYDSDKYARIIQYLTRSYGTYWKSSGGVNSTLNNMWSCFKQIFE